MPHVCTEIKKVESASEWNGMYCVYLASGKTWEPGDGQLSVEMAEVQPATRGVV